MDAAVQAVGEVGATGCSTFGIFDSLIIVFVVSELCGRCENGPPAAGPTLPCGGDKESTLRILVRKSRVSDALKRPTSMAKVKCLYVVPVITTQERIRTTEGKRTHRAHLLL
jgi:hypothetical protein